MKKILVLSDCHITTKSDLLVKRILSISKEFSCVILNGDFLETWRYSSRWDLKHRSEEIEEIFKVFPDLKEFMNSEKVTVLLGNHDMSLSKFGFTDKSLIIDLPNIFQLNKENYMQHTVLGKVFIVHGNDSQEHTSFKYLNSKESFFTIFGVWFSSKISEFLELFGISRKVSEDSFASLYESVITYSESQKDGISEYIEDIKENDNSLKDINNFIVGHTHQWGVSTIEDFKTLSLIYNTGYSKASRIEGIVISVSENEEEFSKIDLFHKNF